MSAAPTAEAGATCVYHPLGPGCTAARSAWGHDDCEAEP